MSRLSIDKAFRLAISILDTKHTLSEYRLYTLIHTHSCHIHIFFTKFQFVSCFFSYKRTNSVHISLHKMHYTCASMNNCHKSYLTDTNAINMLQSLLYNVILFCFSLFSPFSFLSFSRAFVSVRSGAASCESFFRLVFSYHLFSTRFSLELKFVMWYTKITKISWLFFSFFQFSVVS